MFDRLRTSIVPDTSTDPGEGTARKVTDRAVAPRGSRRRLLFHLVAMAGVLGLAGGFLAQGSTPAHADLTTENGLLVTTRHEFQLCVIAAGTPTLAGTARSELAAAVAQVQKHPDWNAAFGAPRTALSAVEHSCPSVRLPRHLDRTSVVGPGVTEAPSPYRTWVHVLDTRTADRLLGPGVNSRNVSAELMRTSDHELATVSTAVLVRDGHLDDPAFRKGDLTEGIGLRPLDPAPDTSSRIPSTKHGPQDGQKKPAPTALDAEHDVKHHGTPHHHD